MRFSFIRLIITQLVCFIIAIPIVFAQKTDNEVLINKFKENYKDDDYVVLEATTEIGFIMNKKTKTPNIKESNRFYFLNLKPSTITYHATYDDNTEIESKFIAEDKKKSTIYGVQKVCGNYEINSIFYSDAKICSYEIPLRYSGNETYFGIDSKCKDIKYFTKVFLHDAFPIEKKVITFLIPSWMEVELMEMNFEGFRVEKSQIYDAKKKVHKYTYVIYKLAKFDSENNTKGICYRYPHILVLSKSYKLNDKQIGLISSSQDLYTWYSELVKEVDNKSDVLKEHVNFLIKDKFSDEEKIKAIYYWVQDNIRYIAFEQGIAGYKPEPACNVFTNKYGDCKGMANLTKEMLLLAGYDARLTWIGTSNLPYSCTIPSLAINDHMICTVFLKDKKYILDATEKFVALDDHAERIQGKDIMIENGSSFIQDKVPVHSKERNLTSINASMEVEGTIIKGQASMLFKGESKKDLMYEVEMTSAKDKDKLLQYLTSKGGDKNLKVELLNTSDFKDREGDLKIDYTFKIDNCVTSFNDELYLDIDPYKQYKQMKIDSIRKFDFDFKEKIYKKDIYIIKIPDGYKVKYLPRGMDKTHEEFMMKLSYRQENGEIIFEKEIGIEKGSISRENFKIWNDMLKELVSNYNDQIILSKIN